MNNETVEKMAQMRLYGMQTAFKAFVEVPPPEAFTNDEMTAYLNDEGETDFTNVKRLGIADEIFVTAYNRANVPHIPVMYLSTNEQTVISEINQ